MLAMVFDEDVAKKLKEMEFLSINTKIIDGKTVYVFVDEGNQIKSMNFGADKILFTNKVTF